MTETPLIRSDVRSFFKDEFGGKLFKRLADVVIDQADDVSREITYAYLNPPPDDAGSHTEKFDLNYLTCELRRERAIYVDNDKSKPFGIFAGAFLSEGVLTVKVRFTTADDYTVAKAADGARLELAYHILRWRINTPTEVTVIGIALQCLAAAPASKTMRAPRNRRPIHDYPLKYVAKVRFPKDGRAGTITIDAARREASVEFVSTFKLEVGEDEPVKLSPTPELRPLQGARLYPSNNGIRVDGAEPIGRIVSAVWEGDWQDDQTYAAAHNGAKKFEAYGVAKIAFPATPAGDKEFAAWIAGEERSSVLTFKVHRHMRVLDGNTYVHQCGDWKPLDLTIDGGAVVKETDAVPVTPAAETERPGFLRRIFAPRMEVA